MLMGDVRFHRHDSHGVGSIFSDNKHPSSSSTNNKINANRAILAVLTANSVIETGTDEDVNLLANTAKILYVFPYTTASQLLYEWYTAKAARKEMAVEVYVDIYVPHRALLAGGELQAFLAGEEEERREMKAEKKATMEEIDLARGWLRLGDENSAGGSGERLVGRVLRILEIVMWKGSKWVSFFIYII